MPTFIFLLSFNVHRIVFDLNVYFIADKLYLIHYFAVAIIRASWYSRSLSRSFHRFSAKLRIMKRLRQVILLRLKDNYRRGGFLLSMYYTWLSEKEYPQGWSIQKDQISNNQSLDKLFSKTINQYVNQSINQLVNQSIKSAVELTYRNDCQFISEIPTWKFHDHSCLPQ